MVFKNISKVILAIFLGTLAVSAFSAPSSHLTSNINSIIKRFDGNVDIGIYIESLQTGKLLYSKNSGRLFMPASTLKLFTAAAALDYLGPDYTFNTQIVAKTNTIIGGILQSDVYFYFDGDPSLERKDLAAMLKQLNAHSITTIAGNIYIDDSIFDRRSYGPGWMWDEKNFCYAAPTNAIMINKNCFPFKIMPAKEEGRPASIINYPQNSFMPIVSSVISKRIEYDDCPLDLNVGDDNVYYLTGCVRPHGSPRMLLIGIKNIRLYAKTIISELLAENNISFHGNIEFANSPITSRKEYPSAQYFVLASHRSLPLSELVKTMLKKSDNLIADALYKKLGYLYWHKTATWNNSGKAVAAILAKQCPGIDFENLRIVDGSGLSHYNLVSPEQVGKLLSCVDGDEKIREVFYQALPIAGVDGSLEYRMRKDGVRDKVHAKTGTMKNISSLAGYLTTYNKHKLIFVIFINDFLGKINKYHKLQDAICAFLIQSGV